MPTAEIPQGAGAKIPRWGPRATAPGVFAAWQSHAAGEMGDMTVEENEIIVFFEPLRRREMRIGGPVRAYAPAAGMVEIIPAGADHWARWHEHKETVHFALSPAKLEEIARLHFDHDGAELFSRGPEFKDPAIFQIARLMREEFRQSEGTMSEFYLDSLLSVLAIHLLRQHSNFADRREVSPPRRGGLAPRARRDVLDYMETNLGSTLTVAEVAAVAGLAPNYFLRAFRQETGTTPHQHLLALRVAAAERMLANSELGIAEIAYAAGFSSQSHMTTAFRKLRGRTPGAYRQRHPFDP